MFSIVVYANMQGIFSSRAIEEACKTDIRFMWLLQYEPAPEHTTTARFLEKTWTDVQKGFFTNLFKSFRKSARLNSNQCSLTEQKLKLMQTSTDKGILLRMNRSIQVEGAFGVLKQDYGFGRFLTRGKTNNETRLFILATAFNIRKLCSRLADGRFGKALFEPKTAWNNLPRTTKLEQVCLPYTKITLSAWAGFAWTEKCNVRHSTDCPPKKERGCCKYDLILQQPQCLLVHSRLLAVCKHFVNIWRGFSPPNCYSHGKGGNYGKDQADCSRVFRRQAKSGRCLYNCILQSVAVPAS